MSAPPLDPAAVLEPGDVLARDVAGEMVLLDPRGSVILGLNGTGGRVWQLLDGRSPLGAIAEQLAAQHGIATDRVLGDVLAFAAALLERRLARRVADQTARGDQR